MDQALQNPLGTEKIPQLLTRFAVPSVIAMLVSSLYNIVDQIFIGQGVGVLGNAATNVAFPLVTVCTATALLFGIGGAAEDTPGADAQAQLDAAVQKAVAARVKELNAAHAQEMEDRELDYALRGAVTDAQDADLVLGLLDRGKLKRKDGKVEGLDEQLQALRKSKPFLFVQKAAQEPPKLSGAQPAGGGSPAGTGAPTRYTREQIARMTPQEINAHWDDVSASLNS